MKRYRKLFINNAENLLKKNFVEEFFSEFECDRHINMKSSRHQRLFFIKFDDDNTFEIYHNVCNVIINVVETDLNQ